MTEGIDYSVDVSPDGGTVWVHSSDGSCVGRFSKKFGLDVHTSISDQMNGASQCLFCTHEPSGPKEWDMFCTQLMTHHKIDVPVELVNWL